PRDTLIRDLEFAPGARGEMDARLRRLGWLGQADGEAASALRAQLHAPLGTVIHYLEQGIRLVASLLELDCRIVRSSEFAISPEVRGQQRILALCREAGATTYLNAPGGRSLYDQAAFESRGIELRFLPEYRGRYHFLLPALAGEPLESLRRDVRADGCATV